MITAQPSERRQRILALDLLRGLFLIVIIVNHLAWTPSLFEFVTGKSALFASAAEGFFVISGILVGYIYGPKILEKSRHTIKRLWRRAGLLYLLSVGFTLIFASIAYFLPEESIRLATWDRGIGSFLLNTFTLRYSYGWTDFLARYSLFMLFAPAVLWLLAKQKAVLVAVISVLIWLFLRENPYFLPFSAWQIVFVFGIMIGYYLPAIESWFGRLSKSVKHRAVITVWTISLITFAFSMTLYVIVPYLATAYPQLLSGTVVADIGTIRRSLLPFFGKNYLDIGRLLIGTLWFASLYILFRRHEQSLHKLSFGTFEALGKRSLIVYVTHGIVVFTMDIFFRPSGGNNLLLNTFITALTITLIYVLAMRYDRLRQSIVDRRQASLDNGYIGQ